MFLSNTLTTTVKDSGWYYLTADFPGQCTFTDSVYISLDMDTPVANAGPDQEIECNQADVYLDGSASSGNNLNFKWTDPEGGVISSLAGVWVSAAGIYALQVTNSMTGCDSTDHAEVTFDPNIPGGIIADIAPENCIGENNGMIEITGITGGIPPYAYSLNGQAPETNGLFTDLSPGQYVLQITDGNGCTLDTMFTIGQGIDLQLQLPSIIELIVGHTGFIEAQVNVPASDLSSVQWNPGGILSCDTCLTTTITASEDYTFQLTVIHDRGCVATAELNVIVVPETAIYIPNIFSPNGDGLNDYFIIYANERVDMITTMHIYDRWGELVYERRQFQPNDESAGWDGTFKGEQMLPSVYTYYAEVLMVNGSKEVLKGDVTLLR
jgi:gliding motility-associated-like protein